MKYPKIFRIETDDGGGEARKSSSGEPWIISIPTEDFRYYGTAVEMKREVRARANGVVNFGSVALA